MSHDTWIHRGVRLGVRPLARTRVTPNHLTTVRLLTGLAAAALLALGGRSFELWGGLLFLVSMLFDRADGELARLSGKSSPWGHSYDLVTDAACNALVFAGIGIGLRTGTFGSWAVAMGIAAGAAVSFILWLIMRVEANEGQRSAELESTAGFDADDAMLVVPVAMILGFGEPLLVAAGIGAPSFAAYMLLRLRGRAFGGTPAPALSAPPAPVRGASPSTPGTRARRSPQAPETRAASRAK